MSVVRPVAILINGAPGSGKSTLARLLSHQLRLPLLDKDVLLEATVFTSEVQALPALGRGPRLWYEALEPLLDLGISLVGDMTLWPGVSQPDVKARLGSRAHLVCVHCRAREAVRRWEERLAGEPLRRHRLPWLLPTTQWLQESLAEPLDLGCETVVVDTDHGYEPALEVIVGRLRDIVGRLRR